MRLSRLDYLYATVCYADIFDYPLTDDDIYFRSIKHTPKRNIRKKNIPGVQRVNYVRFLKNRSSIIRVSNVRKKSSKRKWTIARSIAQRYRLIPTIHLVGVTGGLAVNNAAADDDIDLFFITATGTIWISRLLVTLVSILFASKRSPGKRRVANTICLNMFMSENSMEVPKSEQDLFSAHEVLQMEPLWSRSTIYKRFLHENRWVERYLPVAWSIKKIGRSQHSIAISWISSSAQFVLSLFEIPSKYFQLWYMSSRRTNEIVTDSLLRFHPKDARGWIRRALEKRLKKRNIPLDIIFYCR